MDEVSDATSIRYNNLVYEMKAGGEDVIVLSLGEAFFDIPLYSFADLPFPQLYHYSHSRGVLELRQQLADYYLHQYGVAVDPETEIIITPGSKIAIHMSLMTILNPDDEVIIHEPAWVSYTEQVKLCHGRPVTVPYHEPICNLANYVTSKTKAIIVNNPHNPTGRVFARSDLQLLHELARERGLFIISDEAYSDFLIDSESFVSCAVDDPLKQHTIVCNSMSKNYGMSGWRVGYVIGNADLTNELLKVNQHLATCPATVLEYYLAAHFQDILAITKPQIREVVKKRAKIAHYLDLHGMCYLQGSATFYLFVSIEPSGLDSEAFCMSLLKDYKVSAVPGLGYGQSCDKFIRVSVGTESMERTLHGVDCIEKLIAETGRG